MGRSPGTGPTGFGVDSEVRQPVECPRLFGSEEGPNFFPHALVFGDNPLAKGFAEFAHAVVACLADFAQLRFLFVGELEVIVKISV